MLTTKKPKIELGMRIIKRAVGCDRRRQLSIGLSIKVRDMHFVGMRDGRGRKYFGSVGLGTRDQQREIHYKEIRSIHTKVREIQQRDFSNAVQVLQQAQPLNLSSIKLSLARIKKKKRVGRGGKGKTAGRGRKGWKAKHSQNRPSRAFEGGQSGLVKKIPKLGVQAKSTLNTVFKGLRPLPLDKLQLWIDRGRLDASKTITIRDLCISKVAGKVKTGIVLLATGAHTFTSKVDIQVTKASLAAIHAIEKNNGQITTVYTDKERIRQLVNPGLYVDKPKEFVVPENRKAFAAYADPERRGYLAKLIERKGDETGVDKEKLIQDVLGVVFPTGLVARGKGARKSKPTKP